MNTKQILSGLLILLLVAPQAALATLTATVSPGYQLSPGETPTYAKLNQLGQPSILISGTVDGTTGLTAGSVYGNLLADSVPDGISLNYNSASPRQLQVRTNGVSWTMLSTNVAGMGLLGGGTTNLYVGIDGISLTYATNNYGQSNIVLFASLGNMLTILPPTPLYTNAWGTSNAFLVTNLWVGTNPVPTLADSDTLPVAVSAQKTNTVVTLAAIAEYVTNRYPSALPAYTTARAQFAGCAAQVTVSNLADNVNALVRIQTNFFAGGSIYAVSFSTNGINAAITTNALYYVVPQVTNNSWLHIYTNYATAAMGTNWLSVASQNVGSGNSLFYLTNFTSFNCDVTQVITPPATIRPGFYDLWFRSSSATPYYYVSGSAMNETADQYPQTVGLANDNLIGTNRVRLIVRRSDANTSGGTAYCSPLIHVLIQPQ